MNRDDDRGFWTVAIVLAIVVVAALHTYIGVVAEGSPHALAATPPPDRSAPQTPSALAPPTVVRVPSTRIATVYECQQRGERVFSDHRCGTNAQERAIEAPNGMEPPDAAVIEFSRSEPDPQSAPIAVLPAPSATATDGKDVRCRAIEEEKERIDARMREGYGSAEGEVLRDRLRKLDDEYYELRCHHFRG